MSSREREGLWSSLSSLSLLELGLSVMSLGKDWGTPKPPFFSSCKVSKGTFWPLFDCLSGSMKARLFANSVSPRQVVQEELNPAKRSVGLNLANEDVVSPGRKSEPFSSPTRMCKSLLWRTESIRGHTEANSWIQSCSTGMFVWQVISCSLRTFPSSTPPTWLRTRGTWRVFEWAFLCVPLHLSRFFVFFCFCFFPFY